MDQPLNERFPNLQPGRKPSLGSVNGFGASLVGRRDADPETGTYVTTNCITLLFIPVIPIGAYRVADAPGGGWYCLGKVPLSRFARGWNLLLLLALFCGGGALWWNYHVHTPEYVAGQKLKEAERAAAAGQGAQAARLCREVMDGRTSKSEDAKKKLSELIENPPWPPSEAMGVYSVAVDLHRENRCPVNDLFARGKSLAARYADNDPAAALDLLETIAPLAADVEEELAVRRELLEKLYARNPNDPDAASRLAAACEAKGERERCEKILTPLETQLGTRDGAAILGRIYAGRGDFDRAYRLLRPFVDARLEAFRAAENELTSIGKVAEERVVNSLKSGKAPGFDYQRYERAAKPQQGTMVDEYINDQLKNDAAIRDARKRLMAQRGVVAAVLDLGLVQLQRGQAMPDAVARKGELEAAEKTFLSVRTFAGESDEYRLSLGQVYYWLGRQAEGKKLFDELITARGKGTEVVMLVARTLREVGDYSEARRMVEDAFGRETDASKKQQAAHLRAVLMTDLDDEITWLSRANNEDPSVQASLAKARGTKAEQDGKDGEAAEHYKRAIEIYDKLTDSAATFNNSALAHFALFYVTQDRAEFTRGIDKLDRAIALSPTNSILLSNAGASVLDGACRDAIGTEIDFKVLKRGGSWDLFPFLYRTPAERASLVERFLRHPGTVKARAYSEKLMTLAPKRSDGYGTLSGLFDRTRDLEGLKSVLARVEKADLDLADDERELKEYLSGQSDAKKIDETRKSLVRAEAILGAARAKKDRTFAVAVNRVVYSKLGAWPLGEAVDADELVKLADEAHAAAPSDGTETTLFSALLFRAHVTLAREDAEYAKIAVRTKRSFNTLLLYYVLAGDGPLRAKAAANVDLKRLAGLSLESSRRDPEGVGAGTWVLLRAILPAEADAVAEKVKSNERQRVRRAIDRYLSPFSVYRSLDTYWLQLLEGKTADAKRTIAELAAKGIAVP